MTQDEKVAILKEAGVWDVIGYPNCIDKLFDLVAAHEREKQEEQGPVGVVEGSGEWGIAGVLVAGVSIGTKLYAAPVRTKDLTDNEINKISNTISNAMPANMTVEDWKRSFARAVIAADREKNK